MRQSLYVSVFVALALFASLAFSQEAMMVMNHKEIGAHERPLVQFNHEKHSTNIACLQCHHDFDKYMNNTGGEDKAQACTTCHSGPKSGSLTLTERFHAQCKGCHEDQFARQRPSGPVMCGECHVRK